MPHIERVRGGYRVRYRLGGRDAPLKASRIYARKDDAQSASDRIEDEIAARRPTAPGDLLSLGALLLKWKKDKIAIGNDPVWTELTRKRLVTEFADATWTTVDDITPESVGKWRVRGGTARGGALIRAFLRWCREAAGQPVTDKVLTLLRPPRTRRKAARDLFTADALAGFLTRAKEIGPGPLALVHCLATYGWRPVSAARMTVASVDLAAGTILMDVKGGDQVKHPLLPATVDLLRPIVADRPATAPLFIHPRTGKGFTLHGSRTIHQWFRDWFGAQVYDLKRAAISRMLNAGIAVHEVQTFTGHRTPGQVLRYARSNDATARGALAKLTPTT